MNTLTKFITIASIWGAAHGLTSCQGALRDAVHDLRDDNEKMKEQLDSTNAVNASLQEQVEKLDQNVDEMFERLFNAMDQHSTEVYTQLMLIMNYISDLQENVKVVENSTEKDEETLKALRKQIDYLEEEMTNLTRKLNNQFNNYVELEDRVENVENQVIEKIYDQQDVADLKTQLEKVESKWKMIAKVLVEVAQEQEAHLNNLDSATTSQNERISVLENNAGSSDLSESQESHESAYSQEIVEAYQWAREHELTSSYPIEKANVFDSMSRLSFFKSINKFAQEYQLNTVEFNEESQGNMDKLEGYVMVAKMLYGDLEIPEGDPGYKVYLNKLKADGIITITDPDQLTGSFIRGYLRILLKRIVEQKGLDTTHFYDYIINN